MKKPVPETGPALPETGRRESEPGEEFLQKKIRPGTVYTIDNGSGRSKTMKNSTFMMIGGCIVFLLIKHVLLNRKVLASLGYGIGVVGLIAVSILLVYVVFRPFIRR